MTAYLIEDDWDDWFEFATMYSFVLFDKDGVRHELGSIKIGEFDMPKGQRRPGIPSNFTRLGSDFFSLGQDDEYYEALSKLDEDFRQEILVALHDVAADPELWKRALKEPVTGTSLLRSVKRATVEGQFRRLLQGGARLTRYSFKYSYPKRAAGGTPPPELTFNVIPESSPPTNIHVIIGRNGVGKTYALHLMTKSLVAESAAARQSGSFTGNSETELPFANLVTVSFSAFDEFVVMRERKDNSEGLQYSYIGLRRPTDGDKGQDAPKSPNMLTSEFVKSVRVCLKGPRSARWNRALAMLQSDPIFKEADVATALADSESVLSDFEEEATALFRRLSSGHKIVLLTIARLVETVDEKTLVLMDEPEAHLHPPLLSAFIRALSELLTNRNGVAIIATHSPVILQEVPQACVWKLRRTGLNLVVEKPEIETFGENVGILTREIFGLEVARSGFHRMLDDAAQQNNSYEQALEQFEGKLGGEARAILRSLLLVKRKQSE